MTIVDDRLLDTLRGPGLCELCGKRCRSREAVHLHAKGMGGGRRVDVPINLLSAGRGEAFQCQCHRESHDGNMDRQRLLDAIAKREKCRAEDIDAVLYLIIRLPKNPTRTQLFAALEELTDPITRALAFKTLRRHVPEE